MVSVPLFDTANSPYTAESPAENHQFAVAAGKLREVAADK
jgi:hypothetical protein